MQLAKYSLIFIPELFSSFSDNLCRFSDRNGVRRNRLHDNRAGADDRALPNIGAVKHADVHSEIGILSYRYLARVSALIDDIIIGILKDMRIRRNRYVLRQKCVLADFHSGVTEKCRSRSDIHIVMHDYVSFLAFGVKIRSVVYVIITADRNSAGAPCDERCVVIYQNVVAD